MHGDWTILAILVGLGISGIASHSFVQDPVPAKLVLAIGIAFVMSPIFVILELITNQRDKLDRLLSQLETGQTEKEEPKS